MESRYNGFNSQIHNHLYGTPSSSYPSDYTSFSNQILEGGLYSGRSVVGGQGRYDILLQIEKNKIREEILEKERRQYIMEQNIRGMANGGGYPSLSSLMLGHTDSHHHLHRVQPQLLHGQAYEPVDGRTAMPFQEDYVVTGHQFQRRPNINEIITSPPKAGEKQFIDMRKPSGQMMVGSKRKSPPPPSPAAAGCSSSSKKRVNELSCAICEVSATSERGLEEHLAGKKHQAKMAELKAEHTGKSIKKSPESVQMVSYEDKKPEGESSGKKFKFWCRMCKTGASSKKEMNMHRKGVSHLTNQLKRAQKSRGKSGGKRKKRPSNLRVFTFLELKSATNGFSRSTKIGKGGCGCVYIGAIKSDQDPTKKLRVAVKESYTKGDPESVYSTLKWISVIDLKCGDLGSALKVFDEMPNRNMAVSDCIHG